MKEERERKRERTKKTKQKIERETNQSAQTTSVIEENMTYE